MLLDINRLDSSVRRAIGFHSQGCEFKPHQRQKYFYFFLFLFFIYIIRNRKSALRSLFQEK